MYVPAHFAAPDTALGELLARAPLADLVTAGPDGLIATPLPLLYDAETGANGSLVGHVARSNPHWRAGLAPGGTPSLVILRGPDAYISPSWYAAKAEHGRVVPTWNYLTAHVLGSLVTRDDPAWVEGVVRRLTDRFEHGQEQPWSVDDAPPGFLTGQLRAIVGVELVITSIQAKYKLSQNRSAADRAGVIAALTGSDGPADAIAAEMRGISD